MTECYDCGLDYDDPGFADLVVPHEVWAKISPTKNEGGLLCPTCMVRAAALTGLESVSAIFRSGPFTAHRDETKKERLPMAKTIQSQIIERTELDHSHRRRSPRQ